VEEHKRGVVPGFTSRYRITRLVYFEEFAEIRDAIGREKELKGWRRSRKIDLIERRNAAWQDLAASWFRAWDAPF
jgi:putative endonuclease